MIVVTGASGHLGQWVVARLMADGHDVVGLSREPIDRPTIGGVLWRRSIDPVACDLSCDESVARAQPHLTRATGVVHLAAHVPADTADPLQAEALATLDANVRGTIRLLAALAEAPQPPPVVLASSFEVYGAPRANPIREDHPTRPLGFYGASKLAAEKYAALYAGGATSLRLSTVYGPGDTLRRAVGNFVRAAADGRPLEIHGDGADLRDLVFVEDAADAIARALARAPGGAINVGSGTGHSVAEIAAAVTRAAGGETRVVHADRAKPRADFVLDVHRARERLDWRASTSIDDGVSAQLEWIRSLPRNGAGTPP